MPPTAKRTRLESTRQLRSQQTRIGHLFDVVLLEIFSYLDADDLRSATLVCKNWNEVIGSSAVAMKMFILRIKESELSSYRPSTRNYQNIGADEQGTTSLLDLNRFFKISQAKSFKVINGWPNKIPIEIPKLVSVLDQMKMLQDLYIECPWGFKGNPISTVDLPKLKKIKLFSTDAGIFQFITANNITEFEIDFSQVLDHRHVKNSQFLASFLQKCKKITTLRINSDLFQHLAMHNNWMDFDLKLSSFDIKLRDAFDESDSLINFLKSQAPTLKSLGIWRYDDALWNDLIDEIFSQLTNLRSVSLDTFYPDVIFLRHLRVLENLTLEKVNDLSSIARFNQKLTYLKVSYLESSLDAGLKFNELKCFVTKFPEDDGWLNVIKNSPKIETVEIEGRVVSDDIIKVLLEQPTLRHLKLFSGCNDDDLNVEVYENLISNYGNLKSFQLTYKSRTCKSKNYKSKKIEFIFPQNRSEWNAEKQMERLEILKLF